MFMIPWLTPVISNQASRNGTCNHKDAFANNSDALLLRPKSHQQEQLPLQLLFAIFRMHSFH